MIDPDDIADGYVKAVEGNNEMEGCACNVFKIAVRDRFIKSPGDRLPHTLVFAKKYFITHYNERKEMNHFMYIKHCPNCGQAINRGGEG